MNYKWEFRRENMMSKRKRITKIKIKVVNL